MPSIISKAPVATTKNLERLARTLIYTSARCFRLAELEKGQGMHEFNLNTEHKYSTRQISVGQSSFSWHVNLISIQARPQIALYGTPSCALNGPAANPRSINTSASIRRKHYRHARSYKAWSVLRSSSRWSSGDKIPQGNGDKSIPFK
jgi:hypothetical protein